MTDLTFDPAALKALLDAMPDAPWRVALSQPSPGIRTAAGWEVVHASYDDHLSVLEFIAAARNELPALLDELAEAKREIRALTDTDDAQVAIAQGERDAAREELAKTRAELDTARSLIGCLYAEGVEQWAGHAAAVETWRKFEAEANPATTAEPADEPKATNQTCGHAYIGNVGEFTCDLYAPHPGKKHWNSLAEFAWTDEPKAERPA